MRFQRKKIKNNSNAVLTNTIAEAAEAATNSTPNDTSYDMISYNAMEGINQDDGFYAEVRKKDKTNNPNFSEAAQVSTDSITDDKDLQDLHQLYAVVDK